MGLCGEVINIINVSRVLKHFCRIPNLDWTCESLQDTGVALHVSALYHLSRQLHKKSVKVALVGESSSPRAASQTHKTCTQDRLLLQYLCQNFMCAWKFMVCFAHLSPRSWHTLWPEEHMCPLPLTSNTTTRFFLINTFLLSVFSVKLINVLFDNRNNYLI